ncbi:MAG: hypothetical protein H6739_02955 [Alphaproteobacteria bacterium]|nr:hypothetical protein [Alphaproteobacteria bacterium]
MTPLPPLLLLLAGCPGPDDDAVTFTDAEWARALSAADRQPPPADPTNAWAEDPAAAWLGRFLYFDTRLSSNGEVACATCHDPELGFGDGQHLAEGVGTTGRHAPTIWNTAYNRWYFWDGRADSHWCQALGPMESPVEHGGSRLQYAHVLYDDDELKPAYEALFGPLPDLADGDRFPPEGRPVDDDPDHPHHQAWVSMTEADRDAVTQVYVNIGKSIAAYERLLVRGDSDFDRFVDDPTSDALSASAQAGLKLFMGDANCHLCHSGASFSDLEFHGIGLGTREWLDPEDQGRAGGIPALLANPFNGAGAWSDDPSAAEDLGRLVNGQEQIGIFKTAILRDVALSPPYMHGGHFETLEDVVHHYNTLEEIPVEGHREQFLLPLELSDAEEADLVAFLEALTGDEPDPALLVPPDSPIWPGE